MMSLCNSEFCGHHTPPGVSDSMHAIVVKSPVSLRLVCLKQRSGAEALAHSDLVVYFISTEYETSSRFMPKGDRRCSVP